MGKSRRACAMETIHRLYRAIVNLFRRRRLDAEMKEELEHHLTMAMERNVAAGMNAEAARRMARTDFGGVDQVAERVRDTWGTRMIDGIWRDLRLVGRQLRRSPGFTVVALATLALSLGANTAIFSLVHGVLLRPLPYAESHRIVRVLTVSPGGGLNGISTLDFLDWQSQNTCFDFMAAHWSDSVSLTKMGEAVQIPEERVSARYFDIFGVRAALGRTFVEGEDQVGKDQVVVISHGLWQSQFGGVADIVGGSIHLNGTPHTVIGVLPQNVPFERQSARLWRPLAFKPENMTRDFHWLGSFARLREGVSLQMARAEMDAIGASLAESFPESNEDSGVAVDAFSEVVVGDDLRRSFYTLFAAVGMVQLIACANLANLSLMRAVGREREISIRVAIGAGRKVLVRQFLTESLVLALLGGGLGILIGQLALEGFQAALPPFALPSEAVIGLSQPVLWFSFLLTLLTGVGVGLLPALHAARPNLTSSLRQGGGGAGSSPTLTKVRNVLVVGEIALAFVLLAGSGLLMQSLSKLGEVDPGFDSANVLTFGLPMSPEQYPDPVELNTYLGDIRSRIEALPGVTGVAMTTSLPMRGWGFGVPFEIAGQDAGASSDRKVCFYKMVSPSYFQTLGMNLRRGRPLRETDTRGSSPVTVINERLVDRFFAGEDPIGKRIIAQEIVPGKSQLGAEIAWEVVGVVWNEAVGGLRRQNRGTPGMYVTNYQNAAYQQSVVVRSEIDTTLLRPAILSAVRTINPDQAITELKALEDIKNDSLSNSRFRVTLFGLFAGVSLLLAAIGIYGVISYAVTQRTREIGIRRALGASQPNVLWQVLRNGLSLTGFGLVLGGLGALGLGRFISSLLFGVDERDPLILIGVAGALAVVSVIACFLPALRATKVEPTIALRAE